MQRPIIKSADNTLSPPVDVISPPRSSRQLHTIQWWILLFLLIQTSVFAAENVLTNVEVIPLGKNQTQFKLTCQQPPDFEIVENLARQVYIIKLRNTVLGRLKPLTLYDDDALVQGMEVRPMGDREQWLMLRTRYPDLQARPQPRRIDSTSLSIRFTRADEEPIELGGIEIIQIRRELRPASENLLVRSEKPLEYDISRDHTRPGKMVRVRLLNARLRENMAVPDAETDMIKTIRFEKRGQFLDMVIVPQTYVLNVTATTGSDPANLVFAISEDRTERVSDPDLKLIETEQKKEEEDLKQQARDRFMTRLLDDAEKNYKLGQFQAAAVLFRNIYNFAPHSEIGVRAIFRSAEALFQQQREQPEPNGERFVIQEYNNAINAALIADLGYEHIPLAYYNVGRSYQNLRFYEDAFDQFEIILKQYPESPYAKNAVFHQGVIHLNMKRYERSIESLERFVEENPSSINIHAAYYKIGEAQFQLKRYEDAKASFDKAWSLNADFMKGDPELMFHMGEAYFENRDYPTARAIYEQLIDLYPNQSFSNLVAIRIGDFLREENKEADAIKAYERAINEYPKELSLIGKMRIANILAEKPQKDLYRQALEIYDIIINQHPSSELFEEAMLRKALTLSLFHQYGAAIEHLEAFCHQFPENIYVRNGILHDRILNIVQSYVADFYFRGEYLNALGVYEQYENQFYRRPQYSACFNQREGESFKQAGDRLIMKAPLFYISDAYYRLRLYERALEHYNLILANPDDPLASIALFNKGNVYDALDQPEEAQRHFMSFITRYPDHSYTPLVKKTLGDSYFKVHKADRITRAIRIYRQTIQDYQDSEKLLEREIVPPCWFALGNLYHGIGRYDDAIDAYKNVLVAYEHPLQSEHVSDIVVDTYFIMGNLYKELNQFPEASETYRQAIQLFPNSDKTPWAKYYLGEIHLRNNEKDKALAIFEELMAAAEQYPEALWGPMATEMHRTILNDLKYDQYLSRTPTANAPAE
jgi:tetratricopeptide (TPR) repeat protein